MRLEAYSHARGRAAGLMVCVGWSALDERGFELLEAIRPTHVCLGLNSPIVAENHHLFRLSKTFKLHGARWTERLLGMGIEVGTLIWMVPDVEFVEAAAAAVVECHHRLGTTFDYPNPEEPWRGEVRPARLEALRKKKRGLKADRLVIAHGADHTARAEDYIQAVRSGAPDLKIWPAVVGPGHPRMRPFIEAGDGACHQMMAFHNPRGHKTEKPPIRQQKEWTRIHRVWPRKGPQHTKWSQHAVYHQVWPGQTVPPEVMAVWPPLLVCALFSFDRGM